MEKPANYDKKSDGLWKACAMMPSPYGDDYPTCLQNVTELTDGSVGKGDASEIGENWDITDPDDIRFSHEDNGPKGLERQTDASRLFTLASPDRTDKDHVYNMGTKLAMISFQPEYLKANWAITVRRGGNPNSVSKFRSPWRETGAMLDSEEIIPTDLTNQHIGFKYEAFGINKSVFKKHADSFMESAEGALRILSERFRMKYNPSVLRGRKMHIQVKKGEEIKKETFTEENWKSLQQTLREAVSQQKGHLLFEVDVQHKRVRGKFSLYKLDDDSLVKKTYPKFGTITSSASRVHFYNNDHLMESIPLHEVIGLAQHNDFNGYIGFIEFWSSTQDGDNFDDLAKSCTTKFSLDKSCENYVEMAKMYTVHAKPIFTKMRKEKKAASAAKKAAIAPPAASSSTVVAPKKKQTTSVGGGAAAAPLLPVPPTSSNKVIKAKTSVIRSDDHDSDDEPLQRRLIAPVGGGAAKSPIKSSPPSSGILSFFKGSTAAESRESILIKELKTMLHKAYPTPAESAQYIAEFKQKNGIDLS
jgi:hypothetical protein